MLHFGPNICYIKIWCCKRVVVVPVELKECIFWIFAIFFENTKALHVDALLERMCTVHAQDLANTCYG
jgi:hypothetical protein